MDISCCIYWTQALFTLLFCICLDRTLSESPDKKWYAAFPSIWMACSSRLLSLQSACCFHHKLVCCMRLSGQVNSSVCRHVHIYSNCMQVEVQRQKQQRRQQQLQSAQRSSSVIWRLISQGWLKSTYAFADHTRNALILSVFAFKVSTQMPRWLGLSSVSRYKIITYVHGHRFQDMFCVAWTHKAAI